MLTSFKLYKNKRGKFISLELREGWDKYELRYINKKGRHKFLQYVSVGDEEALVKSLKLKDASVLEYAKNAMCIASPELMVQEWEWEHNCEELK